MTPAGAWEKLKALGYAVCHQIEDRSFHFHDLQSPLCARCTGLYLGSLLSILFQVRQRKKGLVPTGVGHGHAGIVFSVVWAGRT